MPEEDVKNATTRNGIWNNWGGADKICSNASKVETTIEVEKVRIAAYGAIIVHF